MHSNRRGIWFLLSLGGLPVGCFKDEMNGGTGTSATTGGSTTQGSSSEGSGGETTTTAGTETGAITSETGATGSTGPVAETGSSGEPSTGTSGGTSTTGGPPVDEQCKAYAANIVTCLPRYAGAEQYYAMYCAASKIKGLMLDGDACLQALEAYIVCIGTADCAEFDPEGEGACKNASLASVAACPNLYADETTG